MINLFGLSSSKEETVQNNKNNTRQALQRPVQTQVALPAEESTESRAEHLSALPKNLDQLAVATRELLMDKNLEVSKVRPFFWSMVESYVDRFQIYPFDIVKAMLSYLETRDYPEEQTRELVQMLEQGYQQQHGESLDGSLDESALPGPALKLASAANVATKDGSEVQLHITPQSATGSLDDELRELRNCLKYAAMVGELEQRSFEFQASYHHLNRPAIRTLLH